MTRTKQLPGFVLLVALAVVMGGCGGGVGNSADAPAQTGAEIDIENFTYSPIPTEVDLGASVTVRNLDSALHTLTVPDGIDSGNLAQGESFTFTPVEVGTIDYLCDIHQYMKGQVVVR